jgi:hypothetical protein
MKKFALIGLAVGGLIAAIWFGRHFKRTDGQDASFAYHIDEGGITITEYIGPGGVVNIPGELRGRPVKRIGSMAFCNCSNLVAVTIPDSVVEIKEMAFTGGHGLTNVILGSNVISIGEGAFSSCGLTRVTIPGNVRRIEAQAFSYCTNLTEVFFQSNAPGISSLAFSGDDRVTLYHLPEAQGWHDTFGGHPVKVKAE